MDYCLELSFQEQFSNSGKELLFLVLAKGRLTERAGTATPLLSNAFKNTCSIQDLILEISRDVENHENWWISYDSQQAQMLPQPYGVLPASSWELNNKLKLKPKRKEVFLVQKSMMQVLDYWLHLKKQVHSLGVLLGPSCSWITRWEVWPAPPFAQLQLMCQLWLYLCKLDVTTMTHPLVTSCLDYCNALYMHLSLNTMEKLQLVQSMAALGLGALILLGCCPSNYPGLWFPYGPNSKVLVLTF